MIRYIYVQSKADKMASLVYRTAKKQKNYGKSSPNYPTSIPS